jgi:membrane protease subunit HflC
MSTVRNTDFNDSDRAARHKRFAVEILILAIIIFFGWPSFYIVDQSEQAVVTMFGKPVKIILNPIEDSHSQALMDRLRKKYEAEGIAVTTGAGLRAKIPYIQKAEKLERRLLRWNGYPEQIPTKDKKYIWVDSTARW